jgi:oxygen-dependent protoporphyrinogen oxidase
VGAFVRRRLGDQAFVRLVDPLLGGIYGGAGDQLSLMATLPQLRQMEREHGGVLRGIRAAPPPTDLGPHGAPFVSLAGGMQTLPSTLVRQLRDVRTGNRAAALDRKGRRFTIDVAGGRRIAGDAVILATPAPATAGLIRPWAPDIAQCLDAVPYGSVSIVYLAYREADVAHPLDGYGYITPRSEGRRVRACTWMSTKLPASAPEGHVLLRMFTDGTGEAESELLRTVREEVREVLGIEADPLFHVVQRWPESIPQYRVGHVERMAGIEIGLRRHPGCFLAGAAYRGVGIPDCIRDGARAAAEALTYLHPP